MNATGLGTMKGDYSDEHLKALGSLKLPHEPSPIFVEITPFLARWAGLGLTDPDLHVLQNTILRDPAAGAVVAGTKGLRKIRFAAPGSGRGKSGSYRVLYFNMPDIGRIALWAILSKTIAENLTRAEREALAGRVTAFLAALDEGRRR